MSENTSKKITPPVPRTKKPSPPAMDEVLVKSREVLSIIYGKKVDKEKSNELQKIHKCAVNLNRGLGMDSTGKRITIPEQISLIESLKTRLEKL